MRARAIGDEHDPRCYPVTYRRGQQSAAANHFIVRMWRENNWRASVEDLFHGRGDQRADRPQSLVGRRHGMSPRDVGLALSAKLIADSFNTSSPAGCRK